MPNSCPRLLAILLVGFALSSGCAHAESGSAAWPSVSPVATLLPEEREVANLINEYRARRGFAALRVDPILSRVARQHSRNMADQGRMAHVLDGTGPTNRAADAGFRGPVAENCASGSGTTPHAYFDLWVDSAGHRANLVHFKTGALGVGFASTRAGDKQYLTALFGPPQ